MTQAMESPTVCLCIPTYNAESTLKETLFSLINQRYKNISILIVDNCSTDKTLEIAKSFNDARITVYKNDSNLGGEGNFNRCIELARGEYTAIFHADDVYEPDIVEKQIAFLENNPQVGAVFTQARLIDEHAKPIRLCHLPKNVKKSSNIYTFSELLKGILEHANFLFCPSAMVRTGIYKNDIIAWNKEAFGTSADLDVWLRIAKNQDIAILPNALINYRISNSQGSATVRRNTGRADFFRVTDFYLQQPSVQKFLTKQDLENYRNLERRDNVMRAVNLYRQHHHFEVKSLCFDVFSIAAIKAALRSKQGALTFVLGNLLRSLELLQLHDVGIKIVEGLMVKLKK